jgi:hypothetical protein
MFGIFRKKVSKKKIEESMQEFDAIWNCDFDDIWKIEDVNNFLVALNGWLCKKCNYGEEINKLSYAERIFYLNTQLEQEVNNGGFEQFFFNSSGDFANETLESLYAIGADETAKIYKKVLNAFDCEIPKNRDEREYLITESVGVVLSKCDEEFYEYPDNLNELNNQFIIKNKDQFTRN